jgi:Lrp/AsnC family transcriptional regulator of ectoine degradation
VANDFAEPRAWAGHISCIAAVLWNSALERPSELNLMPRTTPMKIDELDLKILEALQGDGRMSTARLAQQVGLTSSPTWERVHKLEDAGILRGYQAQVAVEELVPITMVIVLVALESHRREDFRRFQQAIDKIPQIVECWEVGGGSDYVLRFVVRSIEEYQALIEQLLQAEIAIHRYWSYVVTKAAKPYTGMPLNTLLRDDKKPGAT